MSHLFKKREPRDVLSENENKRDEKNFFLSFRASRVGRSGESADGTFNTLSHRGSSEKAIGVGRDGQICCRGFVWANSVSLCERLLFPGFFREERKSKAEGRLVYRRRRGWISRTVVVII